MATERDPAAAKPRPLRRLFRPPRVPGWAVVVAVLLAGGITAYAMIKTGRAPGWIPSAGQPVGGPGAWPVPAAPVPMARAAGASVGVPPTIAVGSTMPHGDSGACTWCHSVLSAQGALIPAITAASSIMPHEYRGNCTNCHRIAILLTGAAGTTLGGLAPLPSPGGATAPSPTEAEWLGLEVGPIDQAMATRYGLSLGTPGVVVTEAEAQARQSGIAAGDVVLSVNAVPTVTIAAFVDATRNGAAAAGDVELLRAGTRLTVRLSQAAAAAPANMTPATAQPPFTPASPGAPTPF